MSSPRKFSGTELVVASHNQGKVREIGELLQNYGLHLFSAAELDLPEPEETGNSFIANAELKALAAAKASGKIALADDSGFCVTALDGAPGIYSARWAGPGKDFKIAMQKVWTSVEEVGTEDFSAWFACALTLAWPDGHCESVEGRVSGSLVWPPRGDKGFGYDPMFMAEGQDKTFAEVESDWKHSVSHRADAFEKLVSRCFE